MKHLPFAARVLLGLILLFHLFLVLPGLEVSATILVLGTYLAHHHRSSFRGVLQRSAPRG